MSQFLHGSISMTAGFQLPNDIRLQPESYRIIGTSYESQIRPWLDGQLWPRSRFSGSDMNMGMLSEDSTTNGKFATMSLYGGSATQLKIVGITRDSGGAPLGSCVVEAFLTATDVKVGSTTSDTGGYFEVTSPFPGAQHYLVAYKAGSPDVAGTTLNTLTPS